MKYDVQVKTIIDSVCRYELKTGIGHPGRFSIVHENIAEGHSDDDDLDDDVWAHISTCGELFGIAFGT